VDVVAERESPGTELTRSIAKALTVSVPLMILIFVGLVALALRGRSPNWPAYLSMAVGVGLLNGLFFGVLVGFVRSAHRFDD
jgi:Na+/H+ antiporter NhaC